MNDPACALGRAGLGANSRLRECTDRPPPSLTPPPTTDPTTERAVQTLLDEVAPAWGRHDLAAYTALLDPEVTADWRQLDPAHVNGDLSALIFGESWVTWVGVRGDDAVVLVEVVRDGPREALAYVRQGGDGTWWLTSPTPAVWGTPQSISRETLTLQFPHSTCSPLFPLAPARR
jgi:hypothetical protein